MNTPFTIRRDSIGYIDIQHDFSHRPGGRFKKDGEYSGEAFRDDLLLPRLREFDIVYIALDGTRGYGSNWLEEAFGGIYRVTQEFPLPFLLQKISLRSEDTFLKTEIMQYLEEGYYRSLGEYKLDQI